jgi:phosphoribosylformimino-5-aminoimidazole carboxamide ribotide isomerase
MILFPAIDLYEKKAVRLLKGDYERMTVYSEDPVSMAEQFAEAGATHLHVVDLEGARSGESPNFDIVCRIKEKSGLFCEVGGGIRSMETLERLFSAGVDRGILGTAAVRDRMFRKDAVSRFGDRIAVGVDIRNGQVAVSGWTEDSGLDVFSFVKELQEDGVSVILCTDISKDGALQGTNRRLYRELSKRTDLNIIASGGISSLQDVKALAGMKLYGAVIGKALYTGAVDLAEALEAAE